MIELIQKETAFPTEGIIGCQGVAGAYSQIAADRMFPNGRKIFFKTFDAVFDAVKRGLCNYGMIPIENNSNGSVRAIQDLLRERGLFIVRSEKLCISHELLVKPGTRLEDIREIYSHEQALGQCSEFLKKFGDQVRIIPCLNTAIAARTVSESETNDKAAICSAACIELYGLKTLGMRIQNSDNNYTRFLCIAREPAVYPGADRISLILSAAHRPGALYEVLGKFAKLSINMLKLESVPITGRDFEFRFYIDIEASTREPKVMQMLAELEKECMDFRFLGNYTEI